MTVPTIAAPATRRRTYSTAVWGMAALILTEAMIFAVLLAAYFFLRASAVTWPPPNVELPDVRLAIPFSVFLWASSIPIFWAEASLRRGRVGRCKVGLALSFVMGAAFLGYTIFDFNELHYGWRDNAYASIFYTIVGLHAAHVIVGLAMSSIVQLKAWLGRYDAGRYASAEVFFLYWHFVDAVWIFVFASLILLPHL